MTSKGSNLVIGNDTSATRQSDSGLTYCDGDSGQNVAFLIKYNSKFANRILSNIFTIFTSRLLGPM